MRGARLSGTEISLGASMYSSSSDSQHNSVEDSWSAVLQVSEQEATDAESADITPRPVPVKAQGKASVSGSVVRAKGGLSNSIVLPTLRELLSSQKGRDRLRILAARSFQEELVLFWIAVDAFKNHTPKKKRPVAACDIFAKYIEADAPFELSLDRSQKEKLHEELEKLCDTPSGLPEAIEPDFFNDVQVVIETAMQGNIYASYMSAVQERGKLSFSSSDQVVEAFDDSAKQKAAMLLEQLVTEADNFAVLYYLCFFYTINNNFDADDENAFLSGVVEILLQNDVILPFLQFVLHKEIADCQDKNTLFRERSVFTLLLSDLFRRRPSIRFLDAVVGPTLHTVDRLKTPLLLDPEKLEGGEAEAKANAEKAAKCADTLLKHVQKHFYRCPPTIRKILEMLSITTASRFPELRWKIVGSIFFLRFINASLCSPQKYGLVKDDVPISSLKSLIVISKILQNLTNDVTFTGEGAAYGVLNGWLKWSQGVLERIFSSLISVTEEDWQEDDISSPKTKKNSSPGFLASPRRSTSENALNKKTRRKASGNLRSPVGSPLSSPRDSRSASLKRGRRGASIRERVSNFLRGRDKLGKQLTAEQSAELRVLVLDTLIKYQKSVKDSLRKEEGLGDKAGWLNELLKALKTGD